MRKRREGVLTAIAGHCTIEIPPSPSASYFNGVRKNDAGGGGFSRKNPVKSLASANREEYL